MEKSKSEPTGRRRIGQIASLLEEMEVGGVERDVPLDEIIVPERQVRKKRNPQKLAELTQSIKAHKENFHRVMLRKLDDGRLRMVFGFGRLLGCRAAGLPTIRARIKVMTDWEERALQRHENRHREDVDPFDEAQQVKEDLDIEGTPAKVAELWGTDVSWVSKRLALVNPSEDALTLAEAGVKDVDTLSVVSRLSEKAPDVAKAVVAAVRSAPDGANKRTIARETIRKGKKEKKMDKGASPAVQGNGDSQTDWVDKFPYPDSLKKPKGDSPVPPNVDSDKVGKGVAMPAPIEQVYELFADGTHSAKTVVGLVSQPVRESAEAELKKHYQAARKLKSSLAAAVIVGLQERRFSTDGAGSLALAAYLMGAQLRDFSLTRVLEELEGVR